MYVMNKEQKISYIETLHNVEIARNEKSEAIWRKRYMEYDYIVLDGGEVVAKSYPYVEPTILYKGADPVNEENKEALFTAVNMKRFDDYQISKWQNADEPGRVEKPYVMTNDKRSRVVFVHRNAKEQQRDSDLAKLEGHKLRELSAQEVEELIAIIEGLRAKYAKRLATYYKRYPYKVASRQLYKMAKGHVVVDAEYDELTGLKVDDKYYEY